MAWRYLAEMYGSQLRYGDFRIEWVTENTELASRIQHGQPQRPGGGFDLFGGSDPHAVAWGEKYGGALLLADPDRNPISAAMREQVRRTVYLGLADALPDEDIAEALQSLGYGPSDATVISRTEVRLAQGHGSLCGAIAVGMSHKRWLLSNDPGVCDACAANHAQGWIPIMEPYSSGAMAPLDHVGCRCDIVVSKSLM